MRSQCRHPPRPLQESWRSDVGTLTYHATRIHAVTAAGGTSYAYDANGNVTTRYIGGLLEILQRSTVTSWRHNIKANGTTVAIYSSGSNWSGTPSAGDMTAIGDATRRGFTDHSMLDNIGLVHMNGRTIPIAATGVLAALQRYSEFVNRLLDLDTAGARALLPEATARFPLRVTRDLSAAKAWLRAKARGSNRSNRDKHHSAYASVPVPICPGLETQDSRQTGHRPNRF